MRHRVASYNEESGRYRVLDPEFYVPDQKRKLVQVGKAGAYHFEDGSAEQFEVTDKAFRESCEAAYIQYEKMLEAGVAREVARGVLPVTIYSTAYVTMNARALMNFISLRGDDTAQWEIRQYANALAEALDGQMPVTYTSFVANGAIAP